VTGETIAVTGTFYDSGAGAVAVAVGALALALGAAPGAASGSEATGGGAVLPPDRAEEICGAIWREAADVLVSRRSKDPPPRGQR
jgi:hypothetical protein